jgi:hypothetical protein
LAIGFIESLQIVSTTNYSVIANSLQHCTKSPGNGIQSFRVHALTGRRLSHNSHSGWRPSHTNLLLFSLPSQDTLVIAATPRYIASARAAQKTPPNSSPLLCYVAIARTAQRAQFLFYCLLPLPSNDRLHSPYLTTDLHATIFLLSF